MTSLSFFFRIIFKIYKLTSHFLQFFSFKFPSFSKRILSKEISFKVEALVNNSKPLPSSKLIRLSEQTWWDYAPFKEAFDMDSVVQTVLAAVITTLLFLPVLYKILQVREPNFEYFRFIVLLLPLIYHQYLIS